MLIYLQMLDTPEERAKFETLYYSYRRTMLHIAMKILKDHQLAEDAVQEAFLRLAKNFSKIEQVNCPRTRLFTVIIVRNISLTMLAERKKENVLERPEVVILKVSEGRCRIEQCFRIMKTDFEARPAFVRLENRIESHFLTCFLALLVYRILEKKLGNSYTCEEILRTLKSMDFADIDAQGYMPLYKRTKLIDALHKACGFHTDYQFITRQKMKGIQKRSKGRE